MTSQSQFRVIACASVNMSVSQITVEFLQRLFKADYPDVDIRDFKYGPATSPGDNVTGIVYRIFITGTRRAKQELWENTMIYKEAPIAGEISIIKDLFENETAFYNKVWPALERYQKQWNLQNPFQSVPKCYLAQTDCVVLHDLKRDGFVVADRKQGLSLQECSLTLKHLAHFHALSWCMKYQHPEEFRKLLEDKEGIQEVLYLSNKFEMHKPFLTLTIQNAISCVEQELSGSEEKEIYLEKVRDFCDIESLYCNMVKLISPKEPLSVICHGDCWTSNLMFKYVNHKVVDLRMLDFQLVRYTSLAVDLIYILYLSIDRELRIEHFDGLLKHYSDELRKRVGEMISGENAEVIDAILDEDKVDKLLRGEIRRILPYGLGISLNLFPVMTIDPEEAFDPFKDPSDRSAFEVHPPLPLTTNVNFRRKLTQLLVDLVDDGIL